MKTEHLSQRALIRNSFTELLDALPKEIQKTAKIKRAIAKLQEHIFSNTPRRPEANQRISNTAQRKRESEVFVLCFDGVGDEIVVGWANLCERLEMRESYIRIKFSQNQNRFFRDGALSVGAGLEDRAVEVIRTGEFATPEQIEVAEKDHNVFKAGKLRVVGGQTRVIRPGSR